MIIPDDLVEVCGKVFAGEYDVPVYKRKDPVILDIGACVGAFTRWAKLRWPESTIYAYEPLNQCMEFLSKNVDDLKGVFISQCAIGAESGLRTLYYGGNTRAMNSFEKSVYTRDYGVTVTVKPASQLPKAHVVKCDTEGAEIEILENLEFDPEIILVEYHSSSDRRYLERMFDKKYVLYEYKFDTHRQGSLKFINKSIIHHDPTDTSQESRSQ